MNTWHLWRDRPQDGVRHMARDRELYQMAQDTGQVGMRIYQWERPTLSVGRFQSISPELTARAAAADIPIVVRPTGGQAILHAGDLNFSIAAPSTAGLGNHIRDTYFQLSQAVIHSLKALGIQAEQSTTDTPYRHLNHCFGAVTPADIHWQGKKLVGSAQTRSRRAFLQQSVLFLTPDQALLYELLGENAPLQGLQALCPGLTCAALTEALIQGFAETFAIDWVEQSTQASRPSAS
jgi:lipoate-protein ligase A